MYSHGLALRWRRRGQKTLRQSKTVKIHDFLAHGVAVQTADEWKTQGARATNPAVKWPPFSPNFTYQGFRDYTPYRATSGGTNISTTLHWTPQNLQCWPITARIYPYKWDQFSTSNVETVTYAPALHQKLNYFAKLYDWYSIQAIQIRYIPVCPVTTTGMVSLWYEPNVLSTPFSSIDGENDGFDFERYISRQQNANMWPVWQPHTILIKPNFEWKRTQSDEMIPSPSAATDTTFAKETQVGLPDQWYDYGCVYAKINTKPEKTVSAGELFYEFGMFYINLWVKFKNFSFGRNIGTAIPQYTSNYTRGQLTERPAQPQGDIDASEIDPDSEITVRGITATSYIDAHNLEADDFMAARATIGNIKTGDLEYLPPS
jgi:hypothetical protein